MSRNPHRGASEALFIASICLSAMTGASAQQRPHLAIGRSHDGVYTVDIFTRGGDCNKAFQGAITVTQGQIISPQGAYMEASGEISPGGRVSLEFRRDSQVATVVGRVSNKGRIWDLVVTHAAMRRNVDRGSPGRSCERAERCRYPSKTLALGRVCLPIKSRLEMKSQAEEWG